VKDALVPPKRVKKLLDAAPEPLDEHDFGTKIVTEVDVGRSEDEIVVVVLRVGQLLAETGQVVVVHEGHGPDRFLVFLPLDLNKPLPDHVADELGSIGVPALALQLVELVQKRFF
jgi:hypothetical protein